MSAIIRKTDAALGDLEQLVDFLADEDSGLAIRFVKAAEATFAALSEHPNLGSTHQSKLPELSGLQVWPVRKFRNILIFYRTTVDGIEVVRVLHGARDWQ